MKETRIFKSFSAHNGRARSLLRIDGLFVLPYRVARFVFVHRTKKSPPPGSSVLVVKLMGLGSLIKFASMCERYDVDRKKIKLVTFEPNRELCTLLDFNNVFFLKTSGIFPFIASCWSLLIECTKKKEHSHVVDYERCSNAVGTFCLLLAFMSSAKVIRFENSRQDYVHNSLSAFSIGSLNFEAILSKGLDVMPRKSIEPNTAEVPIDLKKIVVNVNSSDYLLARRYSLTQFEELISLLHSEHPEVNFHFTGSNQEHAYVEQLVGRLQHKNIPSCNLAGCLSLERLCFELATCRMFITCDSGPLHLAVYLGVPTLAIWGPTDYRYFGYDNVPQLLNHSLDFPCSPCLTHPYSNATAACKGAITCLQNASPVVLLKKATSLLSEKKAARRIHRPRGLKLDHELSTESRLV